MAIELETLLINQMRPHLCEIKSIWEFIGYNDQNKESKIHEVCTLIDDLLRELIKKENTFRLNLDKQIDHLKGQENVWSISLGYTTCYFPPRDIPAYQLLETLQKKVLNYQIEAHNRLSSLLLYCDNISTLCEHLGYLQLPYDLQFDWTPFESVLQKFAPSSVCVELPGKVPSNEDVLTVSSGYQVVLARYLSFWSQFESIRSDIRMLINDVSYVCSDDFERLVLELEKIVCVDPINPGESLDSQSIETALLELHRRVSAQPSLVDIHQLTTAVQLNQNTLDRLDEWRKRLVKQKAMLMGNCEELRSHLKIMWPRCGVDVQYQVDFLRDNAGFKPSTLEAIQEEVDRMERLKWDHLTDYVSGLQMELEDLCARCFLADSVDQVLSRERESITDKMSANTSKISAVQSSQDQEQQLHCLEAAVLRLRSLYNSRRQFFQLVGRYQDVWKQYLVVEQKLKDPAILANRGGILLKTEKEKKKILKDLARTEQEVNQEIDQMSLSSSVDQSELTINGDLSFPLYVQHLWASFHQSRETGRSNRSIRGASSNSRNSLAAPLNEATAPSPRSSNVNVANSNTDIKTSSNSPIRRGSFTKS